MVNELDRPTFKRLVNSMSKAFRDSHGGGIVERFEAVSKLLFIKMVDERVVAGHWTGAPAYERSEVEWRDGDVARTVYERVRQLWMTITGGANARILQGSRGSFPDDVDAVSRAVRLMQSYRVDSVDVDVKGTAYEELLRDTFEKNDNQQYFTPRHLMDFMVSMVAPRPESTICDPACGSGGFLVGALNYCAQEYPDVPLPAVRGVDIDERMAWVARINVFLHGGDPTSVVHMPGAGSLRPLSQIQKVLPRRGFSTILTNPPFGSDMTDREGLDGLATGKGRPTRRRGVLFIERCLELLEPGGTLAVVIDDSILNLDGNQDVRAILRTQGIVEAVVSLPDVTFMPYSTAKSSIVLVSKRSEAKNMQGPVFMADVENVGNRPNGDPLYQDVPAVDGVRPLLSDLPAVLTAWKLYKETGALSVDSGGYDGVFLADIDAYASEPGGDRLDVNFFHPTRVRAADILANSSFPSYELQQLYDFDTTMVRVADEYGDSTVQWIGLGEIVANSGEYEVLEVPGDRIKSNAHAFEGGDILISKLRPKLRKVVLIPPGHASGVCSAELVVLRRKDAPVARVLDEYVAYLLRSDLGYGQQVYQITGVGRPRVGMTALRRLRVPVPPIDEQWRILRELNAAFIHYQGLKAQAERLRFEAQQLLQDAYTASVSAATGSESASSSTAFIAAGASARAIA